MNAPDFKLDVPASFAASAGSARLAFETWITSPPYERDADRWPVDEERYAWPGQYRDITVQVAWEAWQAAQNDGSQRRSPAADVDNTKTANG